MGVVGVGGRSGVRRGRRAALERALEALAGRERPARGTGRQRRRRHALPLQVLLLMVLDFLALVLQLLPLTELGEPLVGKSLHLREPLHLLRVLLLELLLLVLRLGVVVKELQGVKDQGVKLR